MQYKFSENIYPVESIRAMNETTSRHLLGRPDPTNSSGISNAPQINVSDLVSYISPMFKVRSDRRIKLYELIPVYMELVEVLGRTPTSAVYNTQFTLSSGTYRDLIMIKTSPAGFRGDLSLEFYAGYHYMNSLRRYIPNFMQTYGYFTCGEISSLPQDLGRVQGYCSASSPQTSFLAIEKINNSTTAHEYLKTCSRADACNIYLQVFLSLLVAREKVNFSHYDLHSNNVLIKKLGKFESITYECYDRSYTIVTSIVAVIIDYGRCRVGTDLPLASTHSTKEAYPYHRSKVETDMYRFFASTIYIRGDMEDYAGIYSIFSKGDPKSKIGGPNGIITQKNYYFTYPEDLDDKNIFKIVDILKKRMDEYSAMNRGVSVYRGVEDRRNYYPLVINSTLEYFEALPSRFVFTYERLIKILQDSEANINRLRREKDDEQNVIRKYHLSIILRTFMKLHVIFVEDNFPITSVERVRDINAYRQMIAQITD